MKIEDLEKKIAQRAKVNVQVKINAFRHSIDAALATLFGSGGQFCERFGQYGSVADKKVLPDYEKARAKLRALKLAIEDHKDGPPEVKLPWPSILWEAEEEAIRNELLSKMDLMQQLLMSKPGSEDDVPREGDSEGE